MRGPHAPRLDGLALIAQTDVLVVDADPAAAHEIGNQLRRLEEGLRVLRASTLRAAESVVCRGRIGCVVTETRLPDADGTAAPRAFRALCPLLPVIVWTGSGSEELAVASLKSGAADYLSKRSRSPADVAAAVREALGRAVLDGVDDTPTLVADPPFAAATRPGFVATSVAMSKVLGLITRAAASAVPVLLEGETGTGKELVARAIHEQGRRQALPFVAQNCAALPETLLESELFGHVRGAFTGAERDRRGLFIEAGRGTLFLDEIADLSMAGQAKLLRVLQEGEVKPVGADRPQRVYARVIAATNRCLAAAVEAERFRADLYYRLAAFPIRVPPLRHRTADVQPLLAHNLARCERQENRATGGFAPDACAALLAYPWPGNVRELEHEVHRLVLSVGREERIRRWHLARHIREHDPSPAGERLEVLMARVELALIQTRLHAAPTKAAAARSLGISREGLYARLRRLGSLTRWGAAEDDSIRDGEAASCAS